jgi:hypothetical protein
VGGGELLQLDPAERRDDVRGDVDAVVRHGAGPAALRRDRREPLVGEEAGDRASRRFDEGALAEVGEGVVQGVLALLLGADEAFGSQRMRQIIKTWQEAAGTNSEDRMRGF